MTNNVWWTIEFEVAEGATERLKEIAAELVERTKTEPGSIAYEWALTSEGKLHIHERYADSDAAMAHVANIGPHLGPLGEITKPLSGDCYGPMSDALKDILSGYPVSFHDVFAGYFKPPGQGSRQS